MRFARRHLRRLFPGLSLEFDLWAHVDMFSLECPCDLMADDPMA